MSIPNVRHTTVYRYSQPVVLGDHRLMLRPRDNHDLWLIKTNLIYSPAATVRWLYDVFGNSTSAYNASDRFSTTREPHRVSRAHFSVQFDCRQYQRMSSRSARVLNVRFPLMRAFRIAREGTARARLP
jgi:Bacterial transglutaminase-like N-terminal region